MTIVDTGQEWAVQMFVLQSVATAEEIKAVGGENGYYCMVDEVATGFHTWEINVWGFDPTEVEERAAKVTAFLESRKT